MTRSRLRLRSAAVALGCGLALVAVARAEVVNGGDVRVSFHGWISPHELPRAGAVPVTLHVAGALQPIDGRRPPALRRVEVEVNRHGLITTRGLPVCPRRRLLGSTSVQALEHCRGALVGTGRFSSKVEIPEGAPFPADGRMLAFNSTLHGHPALVAHVYGTDPVPVSQVLPIGLRRGGENGFGATLTVEMPNVGNEWGYVTGFAMTFHRLYRYRGRLRSFISASCPAPAGISAAPFRAARGVYSWATDASSAASSAAAARSGVPRVASCWRARRPRRPQGTAPGSCRSPSGPARACFPGPSP